MGFVKKHFRRNPKTGKRTVVKAHMRENAGEPDAPPPLRGVKPPKPVKRHRYANKCDGSSALPSPESAWETYQQRTPPRNPDALRFDVNWHPAGVLGAYEEAGDHRGLVVDGDTILADYSLPIE